LLIILGSCDVPWLPTGCAWLRGALDNIRAHKASPDHVRDSCISAKDTSTERLAESRPVSGSDCSNNSATASATDQPLAADTAWHVDGCKGSNRLGLPSLSPASSSPQSSLLSMALKADSKSCRSALANGPAAAGTRLLDCAPPCTILDDLAAGCPVWEFEGLTAAEVRALLLTIRSGTISSRLQELSLRYCSLGAVGARMLGQALVSCTAPLLMGLALEGAGIGTEGAAALAEALLAGCMPALSALDLSTNGLGAAGTGALWSALWCGGAPSLTLLRLSDNSLSMDGSQVLLIRGAFAGMPGLAALDLGGNPLGDEGVGTLAQAIKATPLEDKLEALDLRKCSFGDEGIRQLAYAFECQQSHSLAKLNVSCNRIGAEGAFHLAQRLSLAAPSLTNLQLGGNFLGADGVRSALGALLMGCTSATTLGLAGNSIGLEGGMKLAPVLKVFNAPALRALELWGNLIGTNCTVALSTSILVGGVPALTSLNLVANAIEAEGACALARALISGGALALQVLDMRGNAI
jgi:Ran GTPase-activating protein (RanGAP) involved in mRNA processing and transport